MHFVFHGMKRSIVLGADLSFASFGRDKQPFRKDQPLPFQYENESYEIGMEDVKLFPQGYFTLALHPEFITGEPSVLLIDVAAGEWCFQCQTIPSVFIGGGSAMVKHNMTPQDGLCQIFLWDVHANALVYERIAGQMCAL